MLGLMWNRRCNDSRRLLLATALCLSLLPGPLEAVPRAGSGVVVESVAKVSAFRAAGIEVGDVLLAWERAPDSIDPLGMRGDINTFLDWTWLYYQTPKGSVKLVGERLGKKIEFNLELGLWNVRLRPRIPERMLGVYLVGLEFLRAGKFQECIDSWSELLEGLKKSGSDDLAFWISIRIVEVLWKIPRTEELTGAAFSAAIGLARDSFAKVTAWNFIARYFELKGRPEQAEDAYRRAQEIIEDNWSESLLLADGFVNLGRMAGWRARMDPVSASILKGTSSSGEAVGENRAFYINDLDRSANYFASALRIQKRLAPNSLQLANTLEVIGELALMHDDSATAIPYLGRALDRWRELAPGSRGVAYSLTRLGQALKHRGDFESAHECFYEALTIQKALAPGSSEVVRGLSDLGYLAMARGELELATDYFEDSLEGLVRLMPGSLEVAENLRNLGEVYFLKGDLVRADGYFEDARETYSEINHVNGESALVGLGLVALRKGELKRSSGYIESALEMQRRHNPGSLAVARSLHGLGEIAMRQREFGLSEKYFNEALEIRRRLAPAGLDVASTLHKLGLLHYKQKEIEIASMLFNDALRVFEGQVEKLGGSHDDRARFRAEHRDLYRDALKLSIERGRYDEAFTISERSRAHAFLSMLAERDSLFSADIPGELTEARRRLAVQYENVQDKMANLSSVGHNDEFATLLKMLRQLREEQNNIVDGIRRASPEIASLQRPKPVSSKTARETMDVGTLMLSFNVGESSLDIFALSKGSPLGVFSFAIGRSELCTEVQELRRAIFGQGWVRNDASRANLAKHLYGVLLEPADELISVSARLLIVSDSCLNSLPFGALIREGFGVKDVAAEGLADEEIGRRQDWEYLVEMIPIHHVLSATVYSEIIRGRSLTPRIGNVEQPFTLVAFGDPVYPEGVDGTERDIFTDMGIRSAVSRGYAFESLPYTRREVEGLAALFPGAKVQVFVGEEATEERATALERDVQVVHFAAHGIPNERNGLNSALVLSIPRRRTEGHENGLLQAWEILERVRIDADLVVLSACKSALGEEVDGEGLIGLTRAFQYAGARSVAATLWDVPDQTTAELMIRFYRHLKAGKSKDEALRSAQMEFIRGPIRVKDSNGQVVEKDASAPYYWAAFQLSGDWQ